MLVLYDAKMYRQVAGFETIMVLDPGTFDIDCPENRVFRACSLPFFSRSTTY